MEMYPVLPGLEGSCLYVHVTSIPCPCHCFGRMASVRVVAAVSVGNRRQPACLPRGGGSQVNLAGLHAHVRLRLKPASLVEVLLQL